MGVIDEIRTFIEAVKELHPDFLTDRNEKPNPEEERCAQSLRIVDQIKWDEIELTKAGNA